jgi:leader peptidase (prepilin peptidase) / N-methyltransferase
VSLLAALESSTALLVAVVFLVSLLIGSFLNVVIHRLPIMMDRAWRRQAREILAAPAAGAGPPGTLHTTSIDATSAEPPEKYNLIVPRSACPACNAPIRAWQNVPVLSYLLLRGRCAKCHARISPRYPVVEAGTAVLSAVVAWRFGTTPFMLAALAFTWSLVALTVIDIDHQLLPDTITLPLMWLGLLVALTSIGGAGSLPVDLDSAVIGAMAGYLSLWLVFHAFRLLTGKEGMGYGDFKLFAALGAWLGWQMLPLVILLSAATGAIVGLALIAFRGRDRNIPIPFGPYLAAAGWIALIWGRDITGVYLRTTGLQ